LLDPMSEMQIFLSVKRVVSRELSLAPLSLFDLKEQEFFIFTGGDSGDAFLDHHTRDGLA